MKTITFPPCDTNDVKVEGVIIGDQIYDLIKPLDIQIETNPPVFEKLEVSDDALDREADKVNDVKYEGRVDND